MNKEKVDKIIEIRNRAEKIIKPLDEQLEKCHKQNLEASEKLYPRILKAIETELFDKGLCFSAKYEYLSYASRAMGPHYQLCPLGEIVKFDKKKDYTFEDCAIYDKEQLDNHVFKIRIINRYFSYYYPNYDLLKSELNIDLSD